MSASCWIRTYVATSLWFLIAVYCHVGVFYQVFLLSGYPVFLFHLVAQLIDLPLQFTDGVGQNWFVPTQQHKHISHIRYSYS